MASVNQSPTNQQSTWAFCIECALKLDEIPDHRCSTAATELRCMSCSENDLLCEPIPMFLPIQKIFRTLRYGRLVSQTDVLAYSKTRELLMMNRGWTKDWTNGWAREIAQDSTKSTAGPIDDACENPPSVPDSHQQTLKSCLRSGQSGNARTATSTGQDQAQTVPINPESASTKPGVKRKVRFEEPDEPTWKTRFNLEKSQADLTRTPGDLHEVELCGLEGEWQDMIAACLRVLDKNLGEALGAEHRTIQRIKKAALEGPQPLSIPEELAAMRRRLEERSRCTQSTADRFLAKCERDLRQRFRKPLSDFLEHQSKVETSIRNILNYGQYVLERDIRGFRRAMDRLLESVEAELAKFRQENQ
ncbi:hypothetical protein N7492_002592 [Penicillium capsulatum]|uniref:Uncharacterized protein n=1 Tax=Penicillium capsulatum TaxID=69766 RepID=A0A9W9IKD8_9EURO|nr:hypothetical protein N7492_002592 [Penicillium capsulatum]KAJ6122807.1 hypothetical protein N7512_005272 [Penicillium capsulatum]